MLNLFEVADEIGKKVYGDSPWTVVKSLTVLPEGSFTSSDSKFEGVNVKVEQDGKEMYISPMDLTATPGKTVEIIQLVAKRDVVSNDGVVRYSKGQQTMKWQ